jgi:hypothetical protein
LGPVIAPSPAAKFPWDLPRLLHKQQSSLGTCHAPFTSNRVPLGIVTLPSQAAEFPWNLPRPLHKQHSSLGTWHAHFTSSRVPLGLATPLTPAVEYPWDLPRSCHQQQSSHGTFPRPFTSSTSLITGTTHHHVCFDSCYCTVLSNNGYCAVFFLSNTRERRERGGGFATYVYS